MVGQILISTGGLIRSLIFLQKCLVERSGAVFGQSIVLRLLLLFLGRFGNSFRAVFGQFRLILDSIWAVFRHKNDREDCPVGHYKLLIFRLLCFINPLIFFFVEEEVFFAWVVRPEKDRSTLLLSSPISISNPRLRIRV